MTYYCRVEGYHAEDEWEAIEAPTERYALDKFLQQVDSNSAGEFLNDPSEVVYVCVAEEDIEDGWDRYRVTMDWSKDFYVRRAA